MRPHPFLVLLLLLLVVACGENSKEPKSGDPVDVTMVLNWFPEAEHGGFYAALVEGYYEEEGIRMRIIPGGIDVPVAPQVASGQVTFGVTNADDLVFARARGAEVVAVMAPLQISPRVIIVHEESGMKSLGDLRNMTLAMSPKGAFAQYIRKNYPLENVRVVPYSGNVAPFLVDKNFGTQGYNISETFIAKEQGANPRNIFLAEEGYNPYASTLIVSEEFMEAQDDVVERVVRASIRGWRKYMENPTETNKHINSLNPEMGMDILQFGAKELLPMVLTAEAGEKGIGIMTLGRWAELVNTMEQMEALEQGEVNPRNCFTTRFLPAVD